MQDVVVKLCIKDTMTEFQKLNIDTLAKIFERVGIENAIKENMRDVLRNLEEELHVPNLNTEYNLSRIIKVCQIILTYHYY